MQSQNWDASRFGGDSTFMFTFRYCWSPTRHLRGRYGGEETCGASGRAVECADS